MSILIKGMKMPERCLDCPMYDCYNYHCQMYAFGIPARYNRDGSTRPEWCELVELPEKHGRLVEFIDVVTREYDDPGMEKINLGEVLSAYLKMREAKPVIEAEGEE